MTLEPRESDAADDDDTAAPAPASPAWAWPLAGVAGSRLARADAALAELLAAARAARGGDGDRAPPRLRLDGAGAEAVAFVRVRLDVTRSPLPEGDGDTAVATLDAASGPTTEQWDALVRVAPPAVPAGHPAWPRCAPKKSR